MRWAEGLARRLRRGEVRAAIAAGTGVAAVLALEAVLLYGFVAGEYLEDADLELARRATLVERVAARSDAPGLARLLEVAAAGEPDADLALRLQSADGAVLDRWGSWPVSGERVEVGSGLGLWRTGLFKPDGFLERRVALADGRSVEMALSLAHYRSEIAEVRNGLLAILLASFAAGIGIALVAVRRSLRPLREATRLLGSIDAERIGPRLHDRGTGDLVDQHAAAVNAALDRLAAAFERLRSFTSDAAHELRTPINRIRNTAEVGLMDSVGPAPAREALQRIVSAVDDLGRLVEALLLLARLDEGQQPVETAELFVPDWLGGLLDLYRPLCADLEIELQSRLEPLGLRADERLIGHALCNLLDNALVHGGRGGCIEVAARVRGTGVELAVADAGPGIPLRDRDRIFDRFTRLDTSRSGRGAGVGLALARAIAQVHGGSLTVVDSPLGGACFALWLPGAALPATRRGSWMNTS